MRVRRFSALGGRIALELPLRGLAVLAALVLALAVLLLASVALGTERLGLAEAMGALAGRPSDRAALVVGEFRLPRALAAMGAGGLLALAGALTQGATRNPLADPALLGISQGAALVVITLAVLAPGLSDHWRPAAAFVGGLSVAALILALSRRHDEGGSAGPVRLLLTGVGIAAFLTALTTALLTYGGVREAHAALAWIAGSLRTAGWAEAGLMALATPPALVLAALAARPLQALRLGDDLATVLGHRAGAARIALLALAAGLAASSVAVAGPVAFIGLLSPHIAARLAPAGPGLHLALAWATGAALTASADLVGRVAADPVQLPAGLVTALIGAPLLALLMIRTIGKETP